MAIEIRRNFASISHLKNKFAYHFMHHTLTTQQQKRTNASVSVTAFIRLCQINYKLANHRTFEALRNAYQLTIPLYQQP